MAGSGNYARAITNLDVTALRQMGFSINWNAEFDWPYLGMYLPPVGKDTTWLSYNKRQTSIAKIEDYARWMRSQGFHVLQYFNVTEFGTRTVFPPKVGKHTNPDWNDANDFLFNRLDPAILRVPANLNLPAKIKWPPTWEKTCAGGLYYTWGEAVAMDCGEPVYRDFLLDQARRHVMELPSSSGIAIDRMDWLRLYNLDRDDGVSWFDGAPARSLVWSWRTLLEKLGPVMHAPGKVIFVNPLVKRLDLMRQVDGIFDEIPGYNGDALLGLRKPVLSFNGPANDAFLQYCLNLGIHPMCPLPGNDHGLGWSNEQTRQPYLDYGPLLTAMRGKKWVLEPHCVESDAGKVNLFEVPGGYALPVTSAGKANSVTVRVRNIPGLNKLKCEALHPGIEKPVPVTGKLKDGALELSVPVVRGCAMVLMKQS